MRDGFAQRHAKSFRADRAFEEDGEAFGRPFGGGEMGPEPVEGGFVVGGHFGKAVGQAVVGQFVAGQHEMLVAGMRHQGAGAAQPCGQRVILGFGRVDADIGRDRRQKLVAGEDHVVIKAPQHRMVGGVALAEAHQPAAVGGTDHLAFAEAGEARRHR